MCVHCNILYGRPLTYEVFLRCHYKCSTSHYTARNTTNAIFFTLLKFAGFICFPRSRFPVFASFNSFTPVWPHCTVYTLNVTCNTECYMCHCVTTVYTVQSVTVWSHSVTLSVTWATVWPQGAHSRQFDGPSTGLAMHIIGFCHLHRRHHQHHLLRLLQFDADDGDDDDNDANAFTIVT